MALCVRRIRGSPVLGGRWKSGVRGAGGAVGRLREGGRVRDAILYRELRPCTRIMTPLRRPPQSTTTTLSPIARPVGLRMCLPASEQDKALQRLQDLLWQKKLSPKPRTGLLPCAQPARVDPVGQECWCLSSTQLDCFRSLFEPGVCRTPYQSLALSMPRAHKGLLAFTPSKKVAASRVPGDDKSDMEQHLALMHEKLREELPNILWKPANFKLYKKDMEFVSNMLHVHLRGLVKYQLFLTCMRLLVLCYYTNTRVTVLKLTSHPETNSIQARWSFSGFPLHCLLLYAFRSDKSELYRTYDAFSTFHLAPDGLICLHKLERVMPSQPLTVTKRTILTAALLALGLGEDRPILTMLSSIKTPHEL
ncbi:uncharacterized protein C6orf136 homolog [Pseudophryne corroboree]|uniref:uncharacterized protein C6orf136 homolog n=1 Tax=Pseudophryne corroboree TaxID=495146 RepID=UPI0030821796